MVVIIYGSHCSPTVSFLVFHIKYARIYLSNKKYFFLKQVWLLVQQIRICNVPICLELI